MTNNGGGYGGFYIVLLIVIVAIGAGFLFNDNNHINEQQKVEQATATQMSSQISGLSVQATMTANQNVDLQQQVQQCKSALNGSQTTISGLQMENIQLKAQIVQLRTSENEVLDNLNHANQANEQLRNENKALKDSIPNTGGSRSIEPTPQTTPLSSRQDVNLMEFIPSTPVIPITAVTLFGIVVLAAYQALRADGSQVTTYRANPADDQPVYVRMTRAEARDFARSKGKQKK